MSSEYGPEHQAYLDNGGTLKHWNKFHRIPVMSKDEIHIKLWTCPKCEELETDCGQCQGRKNKITSW